MASKGFLRVDAELCKGCQLCIGACPKHCIEAGVTLNSASYHPVHYTGEDCTGCGLCFYACPEPSAIYVEKS